MRATSTPSPSSTSTAASRRTSPSSTSGLHNPAYAWHLIISLRDPAHPVLRPFAVRKDPTSDFGISVDDHNEGSEKSYPEPEVAPPRLVVETADDGVAGRTRV